MTDTNRDAHAVSGVSEVERARMALRAIRLEVVPAIADDLTMIVEAAFAALAQPTDEAVIKRIKREAARLHLGGNSSPTDQQRLAATRFVEGAKFALAQSSGRGADHAGDLARAWDEGAKAAGGYGHEDGWTHDMSPFDDNPYRADEGQGR